MVDDQVEVFHTIAEQGGRGDHSRKLGLDTCIQDSLRCASYPTVPLPLRKY